MGLRQLDEILIPREAESFREWVERRGFPEYLRDEAEWVAEDLEQGISFGICKFERIYTNWLLKHG